MRIVCSPRLAQEDIEALKRGYQARDIISDRVLEEIQSCLQHPDSRPVTEFLATLIAVGAVDIKLAYRPSATGIFHDKVGIFRDSVQNRVSFVGSANETFSAWDLSANHEGFEVFQSWKGDFHVERIVRHEADFEDLWAGRTNGVTIRTFPDAAREHLLTAANPNGIDDAAERVRHTVLSRSRPRTSFPSDGRQLAESVTRPLVRTLQPHQVTASDNWRAAGNRGIIAHVTGAGKTITAISIIRQWISDGRPAIVLVPSELLAKQWRHEVSESLSELSPGILMAGAGFARSTWESDLPDFTREMGELGPRVTIATMATAATDTFRRGVRQGEHLLMVADEVHHVGSPGNRVILGLQAGGRLGLSATPERYGDPAGTASLFGYFGPLLEPPFGIPEAIVGGRLVPYDYFVHQVCLTVAEQEEWDRLTERIRQEYARLPRNGDGARSHTERFRRLLYQRATIVKQAAGKVEVACRVLAANYRDGDRWLVYCDSQNQLRAVSASLEQQGQPTHEYHSSMEGERAATLDHFVTRGGVLVAIRCLDEGVDIPSVNRALILASSSNTREFIQRRGRVLRTAEDKYSAQVHDVLVIPSTTEPDDVNRRQILRTELARAAAFASHSRNTSVSVELQMLASQHALDDFDLISGEVEEDVDA
jgi:superfamily II DNA or RNA helicase